MAPVGIRSRIRRSACGWTTASPGRPRSGPRASHPLPGQVADVAAGDRGRAHAGRGPSHAGRRARRPGRRPRREFRPLPRHVLRGLLRGTVIVPLNTRLAGDELAACLLDSRPRLLLSDDALAAAVPRLRRASYLGAAGPTTRRRVRACPGCGHRTRGPAEARRQPASSTPAAAPAGQRACSCPTTTCSPAPGTCCPRSAGTKTPCSCMRPPCSTSPASAAWSRSRRWRNGTSSCPASRRRRERVPGRGRARAVPVRRCG